MYFYENTTPYRTKTYVAGDWTGDKEEIEKLYAWKESDWQSLDFVDAHEYTQARDTSLNCSIKKSLKERLDRSKTFVLIVGDNTKYLRAGGCEYCENYRTGGYYYGARCTHNYTLDTRSYINYECEYAAANKLRIIVLYASTRVDRTKCPQAVSQIGVHIPMYYYSEGKIYWNYTQIRDAINQ